MSAVLLHKKPLVAASFSLTTKQQECLRYLEQCRADPGFWATTIAGYAGTGKTTAISAYVNQMAVKGLRVAVSAPTNKATRILHGKIGDKDRLEYGSIHSFLGLQMSEQEDGTQQCERKRDPRLSDFDILIIDECSMIAVDMYEDIRREALRSGTFVVFVGDPYQLPPVEGSEKISPSFRNEEGKGGYVLDEIIRQAAGNPIIALSMEIRRAEQMGERFGADRIMDFLARCDDPRLFLIRPEHVVDLAKLRISESRGSQDESLSVRVVAWRNSTVERLNAEIHRGVFGDTKCPFSVGERVMAHTEFEAMHLVLVRTFNPVTGSTEKGAYGMKGPKVFTSEEVVVTGFRKEHHPDHQNIESWKIQFRREGAEPGEYNAYVPVDANGFQSMMDDRWKTWRTLRGAHMEEQKKLRALEQRGSESPEARNQRMQVLQMDGDARRLSGQNWAIRRAHAQIRHAYASTAHKAQGSTWHTAIVDLSDLGKMPSDSDYNRALYVAVTRASDSLAIAI